MMYYIVYDVLFCIVFSPPCGGSMKIKIKVTDLVKQMIGAE